MIEPLLIIGMVPFMVALIGIVSVILSTRDRARIDAKRAEARADRELTTVIGDVSKRARNRRRYADWQAEFDRLAPPPPPKPYVPPPIPDGCECDYADMNGWSGIITRSRLLAAGCPVHEYEGPYVDRITPQAKSEAEVVEDAKARIRDVLRKEWS